MQISASLTSASLLPSFFLLCFRFLHTYSIFVSITASFVSLYAPPFLFSSQLPSAFQFRTPTQDPSGLFSLISSSRWKDLLYSALYQFVLHWTPSPHPPVTPTTHTHTHFWPRASKTHLFASFHKGLKDPQMCASSPFDFHFKNSTSSLHHPSIHACINFFPHEEEFKNMPSRTDQKDFFQRKTKRHECSEMTNMSDAIKTEQDGWTCFITNELRRLPPLETGWKIKRADHQNYQLHADGNTFLFICHPKWKPKNKFWHEYIHQNIQDKMVILINRTLENL